MYYYVKYPVPGVLQTQPHLIFTTESYEMAIMMSPYLNRRKKSNTDSLINLPKVTQLVEGGAGDLEVRSNLLLVRM